MEWTSWRTASLYLARASVEMTVEIWLMSGASQVAAMPMACGNMVA